MALICCVIPGSSCTCERNPVCGGVHILNGACPEHFSDSESYEARIHEIGSKPVETVRNNKT